MMTGAYIKVPLAKLRLGAFPWSGREFADPDDIQLIRDSLRTLGRMDNPITVRQVGEDAAVYQVIAGEARYLAAQDEGLSEVPVEVVEMDDLETLINYIHENRGGRERPALVQGWSAARLAELSFARHGVALSSTQIGREFGRGKTSGWNYRTIGEGIVRDDVRRVAGRLGVEIRRLLDLQVCIAIPVAKSSDAAMLEAVMRGFVDGDNRGAKQALTRFLRPTSDTPPDSPPRSAPPADVTDVPCPNRSTVERYLGAEPTNRSTGERYPGIEPMERSTFEPDAPGRVSTRCRDFIQRMMKRIRRAFWRFVTFVWAPVSG